MHSVSVPINDTSALTYRLIHIFHILYDSHHDNRELGASGWASAAALCFCLCGKIVVVLGRGSHFIHGMKELFWKNSENFWIVPTPLLKWCERLLPHNCDEVAHQFKKESCLYTLLWQLRGTCEMSGVASNAVFPKHVAGDVIFVLFDWRMENFRLQNYSTRLKVLSMQTPCALAGALSWRRASIGQQCHICQCAAGKTFPLIAQITSEMEATMLQRTFSAAEGFIAVGQNCLNVDSNSEFKKNNRNIFKGISTSLYHT